MSFPHCLFNVFQNFFQVVSRVCGLMQISSFEAARMKPAAYPALKDLQYIMREINMFVEVSKHTFANVSSNLDVWLLLIFFLSLSVSVLKR